MRWMGVGWLVRFVVLTSGGTAVGPVHASVGFCGCTCWIDVVRIGRIGRIGARVRGEGEATSRPICAVTCWLAG